MDICNLFERLIVKPLHQYLHAKNVSVKEVTLATVKDFQELIERFPQFDFTKDGELKSFQRPWAFSKVQELVPRKGKLLEIGAARCQIAGPLSELGYEVWVVDPYNGSNGGITDIESVKKKYSKINFVRGYFGNDLIIPECYFDAVISVSVLEHISIEYQQRVWSAIYSVLKNRGYSIDAVDFNVRGEIWVNFKLIDEILALREFTIRAAELAEKALQDMDTFYLSPQAHLRWRKGHGLEYDKYPYRNVTSLNIITQVNKEF